MRCARRVWLTRPPRSVCGHVVPTRARLDVRDADIAVGKVTVLRHRVAAALRATVAVTMLNTWTQHAVGRLVECPPVFVWHSGVAPKAALVYDRLIRPVVRMLEAVGQGKCESNVRVAHRRVTEHHECVPAGTQYCALLPPVVKQTLCSACTFLGLGMCGGAEYTDSVSQRTSSDMLD